jgi:hypothetical protein
MTQEKVKVTYSDLFDWQYASWKTCYSQEQVHLECNLAGYWRVRVKDEVLFKTAHPAFGADSAVKEYIKILGTKIPHYKIAVEFDP